MFLLFGTIITAGKYFTGGTLLQLPQCLDYKPPYQLDTNLNFCSTYSTFTCCTTDNDREVNTEFQKIYTSIGNSALWTQCAGKIKEILCQKCSPYAAHIYDAEATQRPRDFPGLCASYCVSLYDSCSDIVQYLTKDQKLLNAISSRNRTEFCKQAQLTDIGYCYPDLLTNNFLNERISIKQVTSPGCLCFEKLAESLRNPVFVRHAGDGSDRLFIGEVAGYISIFYPDGTRRQKLFMDISAATLNTDRPGDERGLLGIAFHPNFKNNQRFFIYYSTYNMDLNNDNNIARISEFHTSSVDRNIANMSSQRILMEISQPYWNHNGGEMLFDEDGYLIIMSGDGGGAGDPDGYAQNLTTLLGKVLRIDINTEHLDPTKKYAIPPDNPFVPNPSYKPEIYAYGVRNVWRCGKDRGDPVTGYGKGRIICGDVGQNAYEEIDLIEKGGNYGWKAREGFACFDPVLCGNIGPEILPLYAYSHDKGKCVTGGGIYRGCLNPNLNGIYIFGDFMTGQLFQLEENGTTNQFVGKEITACGPEVCVPHLTDAEKGQPPYEPHIIAFGEDESGEMYMVSTGSQSSADPNGTLYRIIDPSRRGNPEACEAARTKTDYLTSTRRTPITTKPTSRAAKLLGVFDSLELHGWQNKFYFGLFVTIYAHRCLFNIITMFV